MRPEAREALWRAREALAGAALVALAAWTAAGSFGATRWVAGAVALLGLALVWTGAQRWRLPRAEGGPGIVEVDERRVTYWGPEAGGVVNLDDLVRLDLVRDGDGDGDGAGAAWLLAGRGGEALRVPVAAAGAGALPDLFTALPGLRTEAILAALAREGPGPVTLWRAPNVLAFPDRRRLP